MIIRYLTQDDITEHDKISSQAFSYSCEIGDPDSVLPCEKVLGAFDDDNKTLFADFEIHEKKCYYDGGLLNCAAIGGVAAKPEHRGKGAVRELFERLFSEENYDISILYPFSEEYYRKLGY
ncbi:MAG: GNAT family N-acetyltransferase, partial [Clostridia bacterium]|nr:GNAT family N-acetyltransferase [Clostridia bacterium]